MRLWLCAAVLAALLAGCSGGSDRRSATTAVDTLEVPRRGGILFLVQSSGRDSQPRAKELAVFQRPGRPNDRLDEPPFAARMQADGEWQLGRSRRLLALAGGRGLYAVPTSKGLVCSVVMPDQATNCTAEVADGYAIGIARLGAHQTVFGLLADEVHFAAYAGGRRLSVRVGENGFYRRLPEPFRTPERLAFSRPGGDVSVLKLVPSH